MDLEYIRRYIAALPEVARPHQDKMKGRDGAIKLVVGEAGTFVLTLRDGQLAVAEGDGPADVTISMPPEDFVKLTNGTLNVLSAAAFGRIKFQGDMGLLMGLRAAFER